MVQAQGRRAGQVARVRGNHRECMAYKIAGLKGAPDCAWEQKLIIDSSPP